MASGTAREISWLCYNPYIASAFRRFAIPFQISTMESETSRSAFCTSRLIPTHCIRRDKDVCIIYAIMGPSTKRRKDDAPST